MIDRHSHRAHAAWSDLIRSLADEAASDIRGTPTRFNRDGKTYWYDSYRVGSSLAKRYIGEDRPELAARIARHHELSAEAKSRAAERSRLVRLLRAEGLISVDAGTGSLLNAMASAGVFRLGGTLVGTQAFRLYEGELGLRIGVEVAATGDIDIAQFEHLSLVLDDRVEEPLAKVFKDFDFAPLPAPDPAATWRWRQTRSDILVEFLTPSFRGEEDIRPLPALGVSAQSLHFLNYLIAEPIHAALLYRSGVLVQIPRPERFAVHKLIVADRRRNETRLKAVKDRAQAAFLIRALAEDRPEDLAEAWAEARDAGPHWRRHLDASLVRMPETAALLAGL